MDVLDALADDVTLEDFFMTWAPKLFEARKHDFAQASDIDLILCFKFQDTGEVYTVQLSKSGLVVEDDEMIDFPALTLMGWSKFWPRVRAALRPMAEALSNRRAEVRDSFRLTERFFEDWEKFDVVIDVEVTEPGTGDPVKFSLVLNDYAPAPKARRFGFSIPVAELDAMAEGRRTPEEVARALTIKGDMRVAATLGGMILSHA